MALVQDRALAVFSVAKWPTRFGKLRATWEVSSPDSCRNDPLDLGHSESLPFYDSLQSSSSHGHIFFCLGGGVYPGAVHASHPQYYVQL